MGDCDELLKLADKLDRVGLKLELACQQKTNPRDLSLAAFELAAQAARVVVRATALGFTELWPEGSASSWVLSGYRGRDGTLRDKAAVDLWRQLMPSLDRSLLGDFGAFDTPPEQADEGEILERRRIVVSHWGDVCKAAADLIRSEATVRSEFSDDEPEGEAIKPTDHTELISWASKELKGKQRRVMELVIVAGGEFSLTTIAIDAQVNWQPPYDDSFNSIRKALNLKLKKADLPWRLERNDSKARLSRIGQK